MFLSLIGFGAAALTTGSFLPQLIQIWKTRETKDLSLSMYLVLALGILLWFIYGIIIFSWPVIIANGVTFIFVTIILFLKIKHG
jgi:MtN3 and saliva related transmembrane protein